MTKATTAAWLDQARQDNPYLETLFNRTKHLDAGTGGGRGIRAAIEACRIFDAGTGSLDSANRLAVALAFLSVISGPDRVGEQIIALRAWLNFEDQSCES